MQNLEKDHRSALPTNILSVSSSARPDPKLHGTVETNLGRVCLFPRFHSVSPRCWSPPGRGRRIAPAQQPASPRTARGVPSTNRLAKFRRPLPKGKPRCSTHFSSRRWFTDRRHGVDSKMAVTRSQSPAKAGRSRTVSNTASAPARPRPPPTNVPGAQRAKMVRRGVDLRNENQYVPFGALGEFCLCGAQVSPGRVCNALIKNNKHDLGSHMSSIHNPGSYYNRCQAPESWSCDCRSGKSFGNFNSVKSHIRRAHSFRGPCKKLLDMPDKKVSSALPPSSAPAVD